MIWYCGKRCPCPRFHACQADLALGSSRGRGTRAAGWFDDLLQDNRVTSIKSVVLLDGVAGWARAGEEYTNLMDEYDSAVWR